MSATPVFHNLWPTTIMSVTLPGSDMANPVLSEFINELDDERSNLTTEYLNQEFLEIDHPVVKWLSDCFKRATVDYACLLYTSPSPRDMRRSRMPSSA